MKLYIGGSYQGKTAYVQQQTGILANKCNYDTAFTAKAINYYHLLVRDLLNDGLDIEQFTEKLLTDNPDVIIICDEIGMGVVPLDSFNRQWRESVGRSLCRIAETATDVERIICGIGIKLK